MNPEQYKELYFPYSLMLYKRYGLPPIATWAQSAVETGWYDHMVRDDTTGALSNNFFSIKALRGWNGKPIVWHSTLEYDNEGNERYILQPFRKYNSAEESFLDYANFIMSDQRYAPAIAARGNWEQYIEALLSCGYATRYYANTVIEIGRSHFPNGQF